MDIPEIGLHLTYGTLGGKFTTLEGLLVNIRDDLQNNPFLVGDSSQESTKEKYETFLDKLTKVCGKRRKKVAGVQASGSPYSLGAVY